MKQSRVPVPLTVGESCVVSLNGVYRNAIYKGGFNHATGSFKVELLPGERKKQPELPFDIWRIFADALR